ncbi:hypothetical protein [Chitinimonas koreensis]|uniref:hypothetical protein n=1 Tax=Chitinimonas koreensis TaxID=356302 RepID=UPI00041FEC24|nr:hypothetical protein [Chitinimonas koreensis]
MHTNQALVSPGASAAQFHAVQSPSDHPSTATVPPRASTPPAGHGVEIDLERGAPDARPAVTTAQLVKACAWTAAKTILNNLASGAGSAATTALFNHLHIAAHGRMPNADESLKFAPLVGFASALCRDLMSQTLSAIGGPRIDTSQDAEGHARTAFDRLGITAAGQGHFGEAAGQYAVNGGILTGGASNLLQGGANTAITNRFKLPTGSAPHDTMARNAALTLGTSLSGGLIESFENAANDVMKSYEPGATYKSDWKSPANFNGVAFLAALVVRTSANIANGMINNRIGAQLTDQQSQVDPATGWAQGAVVSATWTLRPAAVAGLEHALNQLKARDEAGEPAGGEGTGSGAPSIVSGGIDDGIELDVISDHGTPFHTPLSSPAPSRSSSSLSVASGETEYYDALDGLPEGAAEAPHTPPSPAATGQHAPATT